jgi:hypothetical protein
LVTIPEFQQQLQQRRQALEQARTQTRVARPTFSQQQLRQGDLTQRQKQLAKFETAREKGLSQIEAEFQRQQQLEAEFAPQLARFEKFKELEKQQAAFETGRKIAIRGAPPIGLGELERKGFVAGVQEIKAAESRKKNIADFKKQIEEFETQTGSKVRFKPGSLEIAVIESEVLGRSIPIEQYNKLVELEQARLESPTLQSLKVVADTEKPVFETSRLSTGTPISDIISRKQFEPAFGGRRKGFAEFALLDLPRGVGKVTGAGLSKITPEFELRSPEFEVPQKATIGARGPVFEEQIITSKQASRGIGETVGTLGTYSLIAPEALLAGGAFVAAQKDIPTERRIEAGTLAGFGAVGTTGRAIKFFKQPIGEVVTITPSQRLLVKEQLAISQPRARQIIQTPTGEMVIKETFDVLGKGGAIKEGRKMIVTTQFRRTLGLKPLYEGVPFTKTGRAGYQKAFKSIVKQGYSESEARAFLRYQKPKVDVTGLGGVAEVTTRAEGPAVVKFFGQEVTKPLKITTPTGATAGGRGRVRYLGGPSVEAGTLGAREKAISDIVVKRALLTPEGRPVTPLRFRGRTTERLSQAALAEKVAERELLVESPFFGRGVDVFQTATATRRTVPFRRKIEFAEPFEVRVGKGEPFAVQDIDAPFKISKDPTGSLTQAFVKPATAEEVAKGVAKVVPRVKPQPPTPKPSIPGITESLAPVEFRASMVGTTALPKSQFERTGVAGETLTVITPIDQTRIVPKVATLPVFAIAQAPALVSEQQFKQEPVFVQPLGQIPKVTPTQFTPQVPRQGVPQRIIPRITLKVTPQRVTPTPRPPAQPPTRLKPPKKPPFTFRFPGDKPPKPRVPKKVGERVGLYIPFVKRFGKFIPVSKPVGIREAQKRGVSQLRRTLGATLQVREAKTGKAVPFAKETREFRLGQAGRSRFSLVQRSPFRIKTRQEIAEIISSRRAGGIKFIS